MEERPSEEFISVSRTNHGPLSVDLPVCSPQRVVDPVTDFNGAVMNNELEEELFRDGTTSEVEPDEEWSSTEDEAPAPLFSSEEGRVLRSVIGEVPSVHSFDDVSISDKAVCANGLKSRDGIADLENDVIRKNMLFPTIEDMKVWLQEYSVQHHRLFIVQHFDVNKKVHREVRKGVRMEEGENNASWEWFLDIVRLRLVGPGRQICIVSDRHRGILNAVKSRLDGHLDVQHRWCMRHLVANFFKQCSREDLTKKFKLLCGCLEKREFEVKLTELRGLTN
uniref:PH01B015M02.9 protein n=1 Tax=Phyllostachys edulis TaxID=38705 RepID=L0P3W2_PHYED|nr:PH01B015M02.9 [Phyllostachys edulis]